MLWHVDSLKAAVIRNRVYIGGVEAQFFVFSGAITSHRTLAGGYLEAVIADAVGRSSVERLDPEVGARALQQRNV